jgi:integrase
LSSRSAASRRSHLRSLARDANPGGVPAAPVTYEHVPVKMPYSVAEMAAIRRIALNQPTPAQQRSMCAVVGLARGAGLDSQDFRHLGRSQVDDRDTDGIWVDVQGPRPRLVPVRRQWEDLVRIGLDGLGQGDLVIGTSTSRRNIAAKVIEKATILANAPKIEASRLRTTWLADLLTTDVPFTVVMAVSGLSSARTITEILNHLDTQADPGVAR